jgi:hypothetical protein
MSGTQTSHSVVQSVILNSATLINQVFWQLKNRVYIFKDKMAIPYEPKIILG